MDEELRNKLKYIRLTNLLANWDHYLQMAAKSNFSHSRLLKHIVEEEHKIKRENSRKLRLRSAQIPEKLLLETFPFDRQLALNKKKILQLYDSFEYMTKNQSIIWIGPTGAGKTGLATAFLIQAINHGYNGHFILFSELMEKLYRSVADHSEEKIIKTFAAYDCLLIDELGYVEVEPVQVGLFFRLMNKRHKRKSTLITTNLLCTAQHNKFNAESILMRSLSKIDPARSYFEVFLLCIKEPVFRESISLSVALKRPDLSFGGMTDSRVSNFTVGSARV